MRIVDLLKKEGIALNPEIADKSGAIDYMVDLMDATGRISDKEEYKKGVLAREAQGTTGIGEGVAIPHSKNAAVKEAGLAAMVIKEGLDFESLDGQPAHLFFMIAAPDTDANIHLEVLSRLSTLLMDPAFRDTLINATDKDEFLERINEAEVAKYGEAGKKENAEAESNGYDIVAVTACPTGIAHTYMAAEALEQKAAELGYTIKVETNGSGGVKNKLTAEEIANAKGVIVAVDKEVETARFDGKKVIQTKVADGIHKAEELVTRAYNGDAPVFKADSIVVTEDATEGESLGRQIYKHLMNGVSHMLPFVIGGGILIALAFLFDNYEINPSNFGMNTPLAAFFKKAGDVAFGFMLPILAGFIAMSIADRPGLMVGFVGGSIASAGTTFASAFDSSISVVSGGFIGALFAGFAAGYIVLGLKKLTAKMPQSMDGLRPMLIYPVAGLFLIAVLMFTVNPFFSWLNVLLSDALRGLGGTNTIILGMIVGGMMSIDMGGPFNKAAYVFGAGSLALQTTIGYKIMAAVMVGGMVPPIAIAIASWIAKKKFTDNDRKSALVNAIMGLCFISEAAIPYAAADPIHVIPSCVIGSAVAGGLSMLFNCTLMAPHGGVFVIATIGNPVMYIAALAIGSVVGALLLGLLRKDA